MYTVPLTAEPSEDNGDELNWGYREPGKLMLLQTDWRLEFTKSEQHELPGPFVDGLATVPFCLKPSS